MIDYKNKLYAKQKQPGAIKKGAAKQSRIINIVWHLRWLVRTRGDISLQPSGLVRPRTDIKLRPSALVRTRTDAATNRIGKIIQGLMQEQIYMQIFKLSFGCFCIALETLKSGQMTILKDLHVYLLLYQSLYDLTNPIGCNLISVLVLTNALGRSLISVLGLTHPLIRKLISALVLTIHLKCHKILLILLCLAPFLIAPGCFCLASIIDKLKVLMM